MKLYQNYVQIRVISSESSPLLQAVINTARMAEVASEVHNLHSVEDSGCGIGGTFVVT